MSQSVTGTQQQHLKSQMQPLQAPGVQLLFKHEESDDSADARGEATERHLEMLSHVELMELFEDVRKPVPRNIDINLRIKLLKKQLTHRTDLTPKERRALQSRKNTSIFRVRKMNDEMMRHLHQVLIPKTAFLVSIQTGISNSPFLNVTLTLNQLKDKMNTLYLLQIIFWVFSL